MIHNVKWIVIHNYQYLRIDWGLVSFWPRGRVHATSNIQICTSEYELCDPRGDNANTTDGGAESADGSGNEQRRPWRLISSGVLSCWQRTYYQLQLKLLYSIIRLPDFCFMSPLLSNSCPPPAVTSDTRCRSLPQINSHAVSSSESESERRSTRKVEKKIGKTWYAEFIF